jgi:hypothetical protein
MSFLVEDLLKIKTVNHSKIQAWIKRYFYNLGYYSRTEKEVWRNRRGRIDVFAQKGSYTVGIEVDHCSIRLNSIEKLNALKPSLAVFVLKGRVFNWKKTYSRFKFLEVKSLIIHLQTGRYKWVYPQSKNFCKMRDNVNFPQTCPNISSKNLRETRSRPNSASAKPTSKF